jgi:sphingomyelin phosphodiesterase acid-like 3
MRTSLKNIRVFIFSLLFISLLAVLFPGCGDNSSETPVGKTTQFVFISDIHFSPFYDETLFNELIQADVSQWEEIFQSSTITEPQSWGNETNYPLLIQALDSAKKQVDSMPFLLFGGDILAHKFREEFFGLYGKVDEEALRSFVYKTVAFFVSQVREHFIEVPVLFILGNVDSYAGDYLIVPGGPFLADTGELFYSELLLQGADRERFLETYSAGGYYVADPPGSKVLFVCLNTVLFSFHRTDATEEEEDAAWKQLDWLEETLVSAGKEDRKVWLFLHIPPGADIFGTVHSYMDDTGHISDAVMMWQEKYQKRFLELAARHAEIIEAGFAGHTHMDEYLLTPSDGAEASGTIVVSPSISPIFGNNPAFKVMKMDTAGWKLLDYRSVAYLFDNAPEFAAYYDFSDTYGSDDLLRDAFNRLFPELATDAVKRQAYSGYYYSGHDAGNPIDDINWPAYWCGIGTLYRPDYIDCVNHYFE